MNITSYYFVTFFSPKQEEKKMSTNKLKERLDKGPVICAEGFLFEIERRGYMSSGNLFQWCH